MDSYDPWYSFAYDTRWRMVATFRGSDSNPKERFVWHDAGRNGTGGSSYIDACVLRDRDANSGWASAADSTMEQRVYYAQNWRADVSVVLSFSPFAVMKSTVRFASRQRTTKAARARWAFGSNSCGNT